MIRSIRERLERRQRRKSLSKARGRFERWQAAGVDVPAVARKALDHACSAEGVERQPGESDYAVLGRAVGLTPDQVERAFGLMAKGYSPDEAERMVRGGN